MENKRKTKSLLQTHEVMENTSPHWPCPKEHISVVTLSPSTLCQTVYLTDEETLRDLPELTGSTLQNQDPNHSVLVPALSTVLQHLCFCLGQLGTP